MPSTNPAGKAIGSENEAGPEVSPEPKEHGLTQDATKIARAFELPITNSMIVTRITALGLIVWPESPRRMKQVFEGARNPPN